jgi:S-adenosylmethionine hydrolase
MNARTAAPWLKGISTTTNSRIGPNSRFCANWFGRPRSDRSDRRPDWPDDLAEIVYIDHFGNALTGLRASILPQDAKLIAADRVLERPRTFSDLPLGAPFWYENANGLGEIAVNQGRADRDLGLSVGSAIDISR